MNGIEEKVIEINMQIMMLEQYLQYAKEPETIESLQNDIDTLLAKRDIWLSFLS